MSMWAPNPKFTNPQILKYANSQISKFSNLPQSLPKKRNTYNVLLLSILLFRFFRFLKVEYYAIDAIAQAGGRWAIFKNVTEMCFAATALYFGARHTM